MRLEVASTWDGNKARRDEVAWVTFQVQGDDLVVDVEAPFHDDPPPPGGRGSLWQLWEWEVFELFIAGTTDAYTEIELGPHGHFIVLQLEGERNIVSHGHPIAYSARIEGRRWWAKARVPLDLLPPRPWRANAYAIHGIGEGRRYLACQAVPGPKPDYHQLRFFRKV